MGPLKAFSISNGLLSSSAVSQSPTAFGFPGATPSASANGTNAAIVWALQSDGFNTAATDLIHTVETASSPAGIWTSFMTWTAGGGWVANVAGATASESPPGSTPPDQYVSVTVVDPADTGTTVAGSQYYRLNVSRWQRVGLSWIVDNPVVLQ